MAPSGEGSRVLVERGRFHIVGDQLGAFGLERFCHFRFPGRFGHLQGVAEHRRVGLAFVENQLEQLFVVELDCLAQGIAGVDAFDDQIVDRLFMAQVSGVAL